MRIEDLYYTGILRKKANLNRPRALAESKWNEGHEKETMCLHKGGISYDAMIRNGGNNLHARSLSDNCDLNLYSLGDPRGHLEDILYLPQIDN